MIWGEPPTPDLPSFPIISLPPASARLDVDLLPL
jgi:hypothetical protein